MSLTAGTPLQDGKYLIQAVLEHSEFGVTYQAAHTYLDQLVILQTLENTHSDPDKVARFQQQFLEGVRRLSRGVRPYSGKVLDYFTEGQTPYVVMEYVPGEPLPKVLDWLLVSSSPKTPSNGFADAVVGDSSQTAGMLDRGVPTLTQATTALQQPNGTIAHGAALLEPSPNATAVIIPAQPGMRSPRAVPRQKTSPWLPASLLMTTALAGLVGAAFGLTMRFHPSTQNNPIFSNEQAFPPVEGWPIQEETTDSSSTSNWERPREWVNEAPLDDRYIVPEVAPIESFDEEKVTQPEADVIPKTPTEFEGGDPLTPEEFLPPDPTADTPLPPAEPVYEPPVNVAPDPAPLPEVEIPPGVTDPAQP